MKGIVFIAGVLALVLAPTALAKGPTEARISGPGLGKAIVLSGDAESGGPSDFGSFVEGTGFFPSVFGQQPDPMLTARPSGDLGPKYTIEYKVPTGDTTTAVVTQDLYPYADGSPVAYMPAGQLVFDSGPPTLGGWFRTTDAVKPLLVDHGLRATAPAADDGRDFGPLVPFAAVLLVGALAALALTRVRRRPKPGIA
jgi:hypothetical protein